MRKVRELKVEHFERKDKCKICSLLARIWETVPTTAVMFQLEALHPAQGHKELSVILV
jgi:hypothetical protein